MLRRQRRVAANVDFCSGGVVESHLMLVFFLEFLMVN